MKNLFFLTFLFSTILHAQTSKDELHLTAKAGHQEFSYSAARKALFNEIYLETDGSGYFVNDVYCNEKFKINSGDIANGRLPDSTEMNTEHTWPQSKFTHLFPSNTQKSDLHHLYPTGSRINADRGNLPFAEVNGTDRLACSESKRGSPRDSGRGGAFFEPPDAHKGNVARSMFYFSVRYKIAIDKTQETYLRLWHLEDPIDAREKQTHEKIAKIQGNRNPFVDDPDLVRQVEDF